MMYSLILGGHSPDRKINLKNYTRIVLYRDIIFCKKRKKNIGKSPGPISQIQVDAFMTNIANTQVSA